MVVLIFLGLEIIVVMENEFYAHWKNVPVAKFQQNDIASSCTLRQTFKVKFSVSVVKSMFDFIQNR